MTVAACYVSPEGIVLGADSTSTCRIDGEAHYFNHAQKLFEIGNGSTIGAVTWGLGGLNVSSHRRLFALFADSLAASPASSVAEIAQRWIDYFWPEYQRSDIIMMYNNLASKQPFDPSRNSEPNMRTQNEDNLFNVLHNVCLVGFCIAGYVFPSREPQAFYMFFHPSEPKPSCIQLFAHEFWGAPNIIRRLIVGSDWELRHALLSSSKWNGTEQDLDEILLQQRLAHPPLPIRDAIDFVYSCIFSTIKAMKFSSLNQICGGPIELAVITADRPFRWVRHKEWDSALTEGDLT